MDRSVRDGRIGAVDRRTFLAMGVAALGLAGCTADPPEPPAPTPPALPTAPDDPDAALRTAVARSEAELIVAYRAAIGSRPELAGDLAPFLAHHEQHLERVLPGADPQTLVTPTASAAQARPTASGSSASAIGPGSTPSTASPTPSSASSAPSTLAALATAERRAQRARVSACDGAASAGLARDLCLIAASEAQHAAALNALAEEADR